MNPHLDKWLEKAGWQSFQQIKKLSNAYLVFGHRSKCKFFRQTSNKLWVHRRSLITWFRDISNSRIKFLRLNEPRPDSSNHKFQKFQSNHSSVKCLLMIHWVRRKIKQFDHFLLTDLINQINIAQNPDWLGKLHLRYSVNRRAL